MQKRKTELGGWQETMLLRGQIKRAGFGRQAPSGSMAMRIRVRLLWAVCLVGLATLVARIVYLQVFESGQQGLLSQANHIELNREEAARGIIYDRQQVPLVQNIAQADGSYVRDYPLGPAGAPVLGYLSEITADEEGCFNGICYKPGMVIGRAGLEKVLESQLRGRDGGVLKEVDAQGLTVRELGQNSPEAGSDIVLSLDSRLQHFMYEALQGRKGSAVALDMQGKVLGLVSSPSYDPNLFDSHPNDALLSQQLTDDAQHYFLNRATSGTYPPGSVFKLVSAYTGLVSGTLTQDTLVNDTGEIKVGEYRYGNWYFDQYGRTEGEINLVKALARSNDIFFYKVGEEAGVDRLVEWAGKFGLGQSSGIELPESDGLVPSRLWKERVTGEKWFLGNTYHLSIGQGDLLTTPLQIARMTAAAVSGRLCQVSLLMEQRSECRDLGLSSDQLTLVREGMRQACASGGTAFPFFDFTPYVLCKTGTAQHSGQDANDPRDESGHVKPHAWITVAYPGENPELILTVMLESAGEGSAEAGPVAQTVLAQWRDVNN